MDILFLWRLLFDFSLVVLIWLVQIVIYPGFTYYSPAALMKWHEKYTRRITVLVIPLMLGQLFLTIYCLVLLPSAHTIGTTVMLIIIWLLTFLFFVPQHQNISKGKMTEQSLILLIKTNWWRTALWTTIFAWSFARI